MTPINYKKNYELYPNKTSSADGLDEVLESIGRKVSQGYGFRKKISMED
jgi:hypothetical protein